MHILQGFMQKILRDICSYAANLQFEVKAKHISGENKDGKLQILFNFYWNIPVIFLFITNCI
jgi:hypothetical protein